MLKVGVVGGGFVGRAMGALAGPTIEVTIYDKTAERCVPSGTVLEDLCACNVVFFCIPTPMRSSGTCETKMLHEAVESFRTLPSYRQDTLLLIRSTVPVGTSTSFGCHYFPEFLTERNAILDFSSATEWIVGTLPVSESDGEQHTRFQRTLEDLRAKAVRGGQIACASLTFLQNEEAELCKLFRNAFLATKVSLCNEFASFALAKGLSYERVRKAFIKDGRIGSSHTQVPGPDGREGFGGTCLPKGRAQSLRSNARSKRPRLCAQGRLAT